MDDPRHRPRLGKLNDLFVFVLFLLMTKQRCPLPWLAKKKKRKEKGTQEC
jgi:hypothetical protein